MQELQVTQGLVSLELKSLQLPVVLESLLAVILANNLRKRTSDFQVEDEQKDSDDYLEHLLIVTTTFRELTKALIF